MSHALRAYGFSFLLHGLLLLLLILVSGKGLQETKKSVEIDLTLMDFPESSQKIEEAPPTPPNREIVLKKTITHRPHVAKQESWTQKPEPPSPQEVPLPISESKTEGASAPAHGQESATSAERVPPAPPVSEAQKVKSEPPESPKSPSPELQREIYLKEKLSVISQIVQKNITYPPLARRMGWEGRVVLAIRIAEDGTLKEVKVIQTSGYEILDRNAVDTVKRVAGLLPKPPVEVVVKLPIKYGLE